MLNYDPQRASPQAFKRLKWPQNKQEAPKGSRYEEFYLGIKTRNA